MVLSAVCLISVLPWCVRREAGVFCLGGVFRHRNFTVFITPLLPVNFWIRLRVARVVGWMSINLAVACALPSPLLRTRPCAPHSRVTSLNPKKLGVDLPFLFVCWHPLVVSHFFYLCTYGISSWRHSRKFTALFFTPLWVVNSADYWSSMKDK